MRLEVSQRADLAVRAMQALAAAEGRVKAGVLAERLHTTPGFVPHALGPLVKRGWVRSDPGPSGGYRLTAALASISVLDVVETIDGPTDETRCVVADRRCASAAPCAMHLAWSKARAELRASLASASLADLTEPSSVRSDDAEAT